MEEVHTATYLQQAAQGCAKGKGKGTFPLKAVPKLAATPKAHVVPAAATPDGSARQTEESRAEAKCAVSGSVGPHALSWDEAVDGL